MLLLGTRAGCVVEKLEEDVRLPEEALRVSFRSLVELTGLTASRTLLDRSASCLNPDWRPWSVVYLPWRLFAILETEYTLGRT